MSGEMSDEELKKKALELDLGNVLPSDYEIADLYPEGLVVGYRAAWRERDAEIEKIKEQITDAGARAVNSVLGEALNSGDGSYKP